MRLHLIKCLEILNFFDFYLLISKKTAKLRKKLDINMDFKFR